MTRLRADIMLMVATVIWGLAFVAQKSAMAQIGPFTFDAVRFILSALVVLPFALREKRTGLSFSRHDIITITALCFVFFCGVSFQQVGIVETSVTNAGFLTSLYVIFVPLISLLAFRIRPHAIVWAAAPLCVFGVWLLGDASLDMPRRGDLLVIACAVSFAFHVILVGITGRRFGCPLIFATLQFACCGILSLIVALIFEDIHIDAILSAAPALLYTGILAGGIAYTFQFIAQQYTPASDAAVILSGESLFAALGGVALLDDELSALAWTGCAVIFGAIMMVELYPLYLRRRRKAA